MNNVVKLDDYRSLPEIIKREVKSKIFYFGFINDEGAHSSYLSPDLEYQELLFIIDTLHERRKDFHGD